MWWICSWSPSESQDFQVQSRDWWLGCNNSFYPVQSGSILGTENLTVRRLWVRVGGNECNHNNSNLEIKRKGNQNAESFNFDILKYLILSDIFCHGNMRMLLSKHFWENLPILWYQTNIFGLKRLKCLFKNKERRKWLTLNHTCNFIFLQNKIYIEFLF